jgi:3-oxoacyl-[acyl-carrier protein] reductase
LWDAAKSCSARWPPVSRGCRVVADLASRIRTDASSGDLASFGRLDVLVNNAAVIRNGPLETFTIEEFDQHVAINLAHRSS